MERKDAQNMQMYFLSSCFFLDFFLVQLVLQEGKKIFKKEKLHIVEYTSEKDV